MGFVGMQVSINQINQLIDDEHELVLVKDGR